MKKLRQMKMTIMFGRNNSVMKMEMTIIMIMIEKIWMNTEMKWVI